MADPEGCIPTGVIAISLPMKIPLQFKNTAYEGQGREVRERTEGGERRDHPLPPISGYATDCRLR